MWETPNSFHSFFITPHFKKPSYDGGKSSSACSSTKGCCSIATSTTSTPFGKIAEKRWVRAQAARLGANTNNGFNTPENTNRSQFAPWAPQWRGHQKEIQSRLPSHQFSGFANCWFQGGYFSEGFLLFSGWWKMDVAGACGQHPPGLRPFLFYLAWIYHLLPWADNYISWNIWLWYIHIYIYTYLFLSIYLHMCASKVVLTHH